MVDTEIAISIDGAQLIVIRNIDLNVKHGENVVTKHIRGMSEWMYITCL